MPNIAKFNKIVFLFITIATLSFLSGCSNEKTSEISTIESFENTSSAQLKDDVIDYLNTHKEERPFIANFFIITDKYKPKIDDGIFELLYFLPIIGGVYQDNVAERIVDDYRDFLIENIDNRTTPSKIFEECYNNKQIDNNTYEELKKRYIDKTINEDTKNTILKIATLKIRLYEHKLANEPGAIFDVPDMIIEVISMAAYDLITGNSDTIKELVSHLQEIQTVLHTEKIDIDDYWHSKVPLYKYPFILRPTYRPGDNVLLYDNSKIDATEICRYINGEWESLETHKKIKISVPPERYKFVLIDLSAPYIVWSGINKESIAPFGMISDFKKEREHGFIIPAKYTPQGANDSEDVLVMYVGCGSDTVINKTTYQVNTIKKNNPAEVFIKRKNKNGTFENEFNIQDYMLSLPFDYYKSDKIKVITHPRFLKMLDSKNQNSFEFLAKKINGNWKAFDANEIKELHLIPSSENAQTKEDGEYITNINYISEDGAYASFNLKIIKNSTTFYSRMLLAPAVYPYGENDIKNVSVIYVDFSYDWSPNSSKVSATDITNAKEILIR